MRCLRKYYAQTYHIHYAHTGAMHFSFNSVSKSTLKRAVPRGVWGHQGVEQRPLDPPPPSSEKLPLLYKHLVEIGN